MTGDSLLVSVDALAGQSSSHLSLKGPVSEKPQCGHDYQLGTELLLYSFRFSKAAWTLDRLSEEDSQIPCVMCLQNLWA